MALQRFLRVFLISRQTFFRFPWALGMAFLATLLAIYQIETESSSIAAGQLLQMCVLGAGLFTGLELYLESLDISNRQRSYAQILGLIALFFYYIIQPKHPTLIDFIRFILLIISVFLTITFTPYLHQKNSESFWFYNEQLLIRILVGSFYSITLYLGIIVAIASMDHLFNFHLSDKIYLETFLLVVGIFGTWFFLAGIPQKFDKLITGEPYPQRLKLFTVYILLPLLSLYLLILYAYMFKIILAWNLPQGWVTYLIVVFSMVGILALLLVHPFEKESKSIKTFSNRFYISLLPLIFLVFVAVGRRILDYGITENRYFVILIAVWLLGISLYFLLRKEKKIKVIPISLCLLAFFSSLGHWDAFQVAERSQIARLDRLFKKNNLLEQEKISFEKARRANISERDAKEIGSIINFLGQRESLGELQAYFGLNLDSIFTESPDPISKEEKLLNLIGNRQLLWSINLPIYSNEINFSATQNEKLQKIKGYDYSLRFENYSNQDQPQTFSLDNFEIRLKPQFQQNALRIYHHENDEVLIEFNLNQTLQNLIHNFQKKPDNVPLSYLTLVQESEHYKAKLQITNISVIHRGKFENQCRGLSGIIFLKFN